MPSNRLTKIENLSHLRHLEELYLSHNGLTSMKGIEELVELKTLDISSNRIEKLQSLERLTKLVDFWANDNKLSDFEELNVLLNAPGLHTVYLERNPLAEDPNYETRVLLTLKDLKQLDALPVERVKEKLLTRRAEESSS